MFRWFIIIFAVSLLGAYLLFLRTAKQSAAGSHRQKPKEKRRESNSQPSSPEVHRPAGGRKDIPKKRAKPSAITRHPQLLATLLAKSATGASPRILSIAVSERAIAVATDDRTLKAYHLPTADSTAVDFSRAKVFKSDVQREGITAVEFERNGRLMGAFEYPIRVARFEIPKDQRKQILVVDDDRVKHRSSHKEAIGWISAQCMKNSLFCTGGTEADTDIKLWRGDNELSTIDTKQIKNLNFAASHDGRFVGAASWSSGIKLYEITKKDVLKKAMDLKTPCGTTAFAFSTDCKRVITACKNGTLMLWKVDVRFEDGEDPKLLGKLEEASETLPISQIEFSGDGKMVVSARGTSLEFRDPESLTVLETVGPVHTDAIRFLRADPTGKFFVTAAADNNLRVWSFAREA